MPVKVLIVDDQPSFRAAARAVVEATDGFELVAEAESGEASIEAAARTEPDLILIDVPCRDQRARRHALHPPRSRRHRRAAAIDTQPRGLRPAGLCVWRRRLPTQGGVGAGHAARDLESGQQVTLRLVLAEDSYVVREGVIRILEQDPELELQASCHDLQSLLTTVAADPPDVVVTDIRMPPTNTDEGIRAAVSLRGSHPSMGVVVLSQYDEAEYVVKLFERGAAGRAYLLKDRLAEPSQLTRAVREVAAGGSVVDPNVVELLVAERARFTASPLAPLTPREREVLAEMATGKSNDAIASVLSLSVGVVEKHINSIFSKLGLSEESTSIAVSGQC